MPLATPPASSYRKGHAKMGVNGGFRSQSFGRHPDWRRMRRLDSNLGKGCVRRGGRRVRMNKAKVGFLTIALACCHGLGEQNAREKQPEAKQAKTPITIRTKAGRPEQSAFLVEPLQLISFSELAAAVRSAGYGCEAVKAFDQLEQNGKRMNVYMIQCLEYTYQATFLNGKSHIKRWTGISLANEIVGRSRRSVRIPDWRA